VIATEGAAFQMLDGNAYGMNSQGLYDPELIAHYAANRIVKGSQLSKTVKLVGLSGRYTFELAGGKYYAMARNLAHQEGRSIRRFTTAVFDMVPIQGDFRKELSKSDPGYYFRPHKTLLVRTVADGGERVHFCGDPAPTFPAVGRRYPAAGGVDT